MKFSVLPATYALVAVIFAATIPVQAAPPWKGGPANGKGGKYQKHGPKGPMAGPGAFRPGPPPWAPAHGYRRKGNGGYPFPAGLLDGRCRVDLLDGPTAGGLLGAAAGGLAGSQFGKGDGKLAATAIGTLIGFVIGQEVGRQLTPVEETCFSQTFEHVPDRETIVWRNAQQDAQYQVTPIGTTEVGTGMYCREYQAKATVGDRVEETYGTACRQPDGSWKLMN
jgi:surface antigen